MYQPLLFIHSWTRWIVLLTGLYFTVRCYYGWMLKKPWGGQDNQFMWAFSQILGYQVLFGLALYLGASPFVKIAFSDHRAITQNEVVAFWVTRHGPTMLVSLAVFLIGSRFAKKTPIQNRYRAYAITFTLLMATILSAIPWAGLAYGRPWFRWYF